MTKNAESIPFTHGQIARPRLIAMLSQADKTKVTVISAAPGYGKTTIAAQFARQSSQAIVWHTITERERDVPNLHQKSLQVLRTHFPDLADVPAMPGIGASVLAAKLATVLEDQGGAPFFYVLDDVHLLDGVPAAGSWLQTLVKRLPSFCHLILVSRTLPDLPFTELLARRELLAIGQEHLQFTVEEIEQLAALAPSTPDPAVIRQALTQLEGWPAGTVLALQPLPASLEQQLLKGQGGPEGLFNNLAEAMLGMQPPGLRQFLLQSSTLVRFTPDLCEKALGLENVFHWVAETQRRNLFLSSVTGGLAYHSLFREFLQKQLQAQQPATYIGLHQKAGHWYQTKNQLETAFSHLATAGCFAEAAQLAESVAHAFFTQGKVETLQQFNQSLQQSQVPIPQLQLVCAMTQINRHAYEMAEENLARAEAGFRQTKNRVGRYQVAVQRVFRQAQQGQYREAAQAAEGLLQKADLPSNLRGFALRQLGVSRLFLGEISTAIKHLEEALILHEAVEDDHATSLLLQDLEVAYTRGGRLAEAQLCLQKVVDMRRRLNNPIDLALALNNLGYHYHKAGDYAQALETFLEGLRLMVDTTGNRVEGLLLWSLADLQRDRGDFREAQQLYDRGLVLVSNRYPALRCALLTNLSILHRWQKDRGQAIQAACAAVELAEAHGLSFELLGARAAHAVAHLEGANNEHYRQVLKTIAVSLQDGPPSDEFVRVYAYCAQAALLGNDSCAAETYLADALALLDQDGSIQGLIAEIAYTPGLEGWVARQSADYAVILQGLEELRANQVVSSEPDPAATRRTPTYSLQVMTLGQSRVIRDGQPVMVSDWRSDKARALFLYLLFTGGNSREQISLAFWPDSAIQRVRSNFHTTLYRARQAVGDNVIVFQDERYQINPQIDLWCDAQEFAGLTQKASLLSPHNAQTDDLWRRAIDLYTGEFLPALDGEWIIGYRESCAEAYLSALIGRGRCAYARQHFTQAIGYYQQALAHDPYREDVYRAMMRCHAETGERSLVLTCWQQLQGVLQNDLALPPSRETTILAEALLR